MCPAHTKHIWVVCGSDLPSRRNVNKLVAIANRNAVIDKAQVSGHVIEVAIALERKRWRNEEKLIYMDDIVGKCIKIETILRTCVDDVPARCC